MTLHMPPPNLSANVESFIKRQHQHYIDGAWRKSSSDERVPVIDPALGTEITSIPAGTSDDVDLAVQAARRAFEGGPWHTMPAYERGRLIARLSEKLLQHLDEFAEIEAIDCGKPIMFAKAVDVPLTSRVYGYHAGWASKIAGETLSPTMPGDFHAFTVREPVGVVGAIAPWNFPLLLTAMKLAPLLAAGCTAVIKPSEVTSLSTLRLMELVNEVGFPPGVINVVCGYGSTVGAAIAAHPGIDKVSFTGSVETGKKILAASAGNLKRVTLELGGKSPMIVFPDVDLERAIPALAQAIFFHQGQICTAGSRLYVHASIHDKVIAGLAEQAKSFTLGHTLDPKTTMGPIASEAQLAKIMSYLDLGQQAGAERVVGGERRGTSGYFIEPAVLTRTRDDMAIVKEEIFGPVLCASSFGDDDIGAVVGRANDSIYGLAASVWTRDLSTAHKVAKRLRAGSVWINGHNLFDPALPFGGFKQSGWGREQGSEAYRHYTEVKSVCAAL